MRSDEYQIEDCDMRARVRRAFEIDEGIEIPSCVFNSPQFQVNILIYIITLFCVFTITIDQLCSFRWLVRKNCVRFCSNNKYRHRPHLSIEQLLSMGVYILRLFHK